MNDIVNSEFIKTHQEEILKLGDRIPECVIKHIPMPKIIEYFEYNTKTNKLFREEFKTINDWIESEKAVINYFQNNIHFLKEWIDCYPQFKGIINEK